jgi:hypothetical protein
MKDALETVEREHRNEKRTPHRASIAQRVNRLWHKMSDARSEQDTDGYADDIGKGNSKPDAGSMKRQHRQSGCHLYADHGDQRF